MACHASGLPEAPRRVVRRAPYNCPTDAPMSEKATLPAASSRLMRRLNIHAPSWSTTSRRRWATVKVGPRGGSTRTIATLARVSSASVATMARVPLVALIPTSSAAGRGTTGPPAKCFLMLSATAAGSTSPTTMTVMLLGLYQRV